MTEYIPAAASAAPAPSLVPMHPVAPGSRAAAQVAGSVLRAPKPLDRKHTPL
jgi:hypothetical protein